MSLSAAQIDVLIAPYYLAMAGWSAPTADDALLASVRAAAGQVGDDTVRTMLRIDWRPGVMGAWFAVAKSDPAFSDDVHDSLLTCHGTLTSVPLVAAILTYPSARTMDVLVGHYCDDMERQLGGAKLLAAAAARHARATRVDSPLPPASAESVETLEDLMRVADSLSR